MVTVHDIFLLFIVKFLEFDQYCGCQSHNWCYNFWTKIARNHHSVLSQALPIELPGAACRWLKDSTGRNVCLFTYAIRSLLF